MKLHTNMSWQELCLELGHEEWCKIKSSCSRNSRLKKMQREVNVQHITLSHGQGFYIIIDINPLYDYPCFVYEQVQPNQKYGKLTTIKSYKDKKNGMAWECICECGNTTTVKATQLLSGKTKSCGCLQKEKAWGHDRDKNKQKTEELVSYKENPKLFVKQQRQAMTPALRYSILKRDNFHCCCCGRGVEDGVKLHVDHILPVSKGGKTEEKNLQTLCKDCNLGKSDSI